MLFAIFPDRLENEVEVGLAGCFIGGVTTEFAAGRIIGGWQ
jgi:hypothetical protein